MEIEKSKQSIEIVGQSTHVLSNPPAFKVAKSEVFKIVQSAVATAYADLMFKVPDDKTRDYLLNELTDNIRRNYKTLRAEEILIAFKKGTRGEYGEFMGLSVVTFEKFIAGYLESSFRAELGKTAPLIQAPVSEKVITRNDRIEFAKNAFIKFKFHDTYNDLGNIVYDFLDSEGLITFTAKEKYEVMNQVRQRAYAKYSAPVTMREKKDFEAQINKLVESNEPLIPESKRACLNLFFAKLKADGKELEFK